MAPAPEPRSDCSGWDDCGRGIGRLAARWKAASGEGSSRFVGLAQPAEEVRVHVLDRLDADAVADHAVEAARRLQPAGRFLALEVDADVESRGRGRLEDRELFRPPQTDIRL